MLVFLPSLVLTGMSRHSEPGTQYHNPVSIARRSMPPIRSIFLSHTKADKPLVEQIANRLAKLYGQESIFYDSWSIQPGDGIIERMNTGVHEASIFFFFVSANSLASNMVE